MFYRIFYAETKRLRLFVRLKITVNISAINTNISKERNKTLKDFARINFRGKGQNRETAKVSSAKVYDLKVLSK